MRVIIGEDVRIAAARDVALLGRKGKVVMETMHTLTIRMNADEHKLTLPKRGSAVELATGEILLGDTDLRGRLEDRVAIIGARRVPAALEGRAGRRSGTSR
jgi:RNase P/RNase MRP subunit p29